MYTITPRLNLILTHAKAWTSQTASQNSDAMLLPVFGSRQKVFLFPSFVSSFPPSLPFCARDPRVLHTGQSSPRPDDGFLGRPGQQPCPISVALPMPFALPWPAVGHLCLSSDFSFNPVVTDQLKLPRSAQVTHTTPMEDRFRLFPGRP